MPTTRRIGLGAFGALGLTALFATPGFAEAAPAEGCDTRSGAGGQRVTLYIDQNTKQILAEPGANRVRLGEFEMVDPCADRAAAAGRGLTTEEPASLATAPAETLDKTRTTAKSSLGIDDRPATLVLTDESHSFEVGLSGRLHADYNYENPNDYVERDSGAEQNAATGTEIRRARIGVEGTFGDDLGFMLESDFADNEVGIKDAFLVYSGVDPLEFTLGQQKQAISMELQESSNDIMFTERSLVNSLTGPLFDRAIGANLKGSGHDWSAQIGAYGDTIEPNGDREQATEGYGASTRLTWAPINSEDYVIHLGSFAGLRESAEDNGVLDGSPRYSYETTHMSNARFLNTGTIENFDRVYMGGLEFAAMAGPYSIQSEYVVTQTDRSQGLSDLNYDAGYVQLGWTLTGESRVYRGSDGEFKGLRPDEPFDLKAGTYGAVELAGRFDYADLNDADVQGGEGTRATAALNWYLNRHVRLMADYSRVINTQASPLVTQNGGSVDGADIFTFRTQWAF